VHPFLRSLFRNGRLLRRHWVHRVHVVGRHHELRVLVGRVVHGRKLALVEHLGVLLGVIEVLVLHVLL